MVQAVAVKDKDLGLKKIIAELDGMSKAEVLIGVQEGSKTHVNIVRGRKQKAGINIAEYAAENEFGTNKIPERSFLRSFFDENLTLIESYVARVYGRIIDGDISLNTGLQQIGTQLQDGVKLKIRQIHLPANSKKTIALKGSTKPLIDFGQMFASIRYVVKFRK